METIDDVAGHRSPSVPGYKRGVEVADARAERAPHIEPVSDGSGASVVSAAPLARAKDSGTAIALALERERRRVADELHDTAIQQLVLARILIDRSREQGAADESDRVRRLLDDALEQLRSLVLGLTPAVLYRDGLCPAIEWLCEQLGTRWRLHCHCRVVGDPAPLPHAVTETLFQGALELMTNVGRRAHARTCEVVLSYGGDRVELSVRDDGIGIDPRRTVGAPSGGNGGFGLFSLRARSVELGGLLRLAAGERGRSPRGPVPAAARARAPRDWYASPGNR
jgi:two-component system NarL family sensor kinase